MLRYGLACHHTDFGGRLITEQRLILNSTVVAASKFGAAISSSIFRTTSLSDNIITKRLFRLAAAATGPPARAICLVVRKPALELSLQRRSGKVLSQ